MGSIRNLKSNTFNGQYCSFASSGVFDSHFLFQGEMPIVIYDEATEEDAERCIEHYNGLSGKKEVSETIQKGLAFFFFEMVNECSWDAETKKTLASIMDEYKAGKQLISYLYKPILDVEPQLEGEIGYGITCECLWEPEHMCSILIRNDKVVYVGPGGDYTPWDDVDEYYASWVEAE